MQEGGQKGSGGSQQEIPDSQRLGVLVKGFSPCSNSFPCFLKADWLHLQTATDTSTGLSDQCVAIGRRLFFWCLSGCGISVKGQICEGRWLASS